MTYNPTLHRWEGNEAALTPFTMAASPDYMAAQPSQPRHHYYHHQHHHSYPNNPHDHSFRPNPPPSPPRPALISHIPTTTHAVRVERGMIFDPISMRWLRHRGANRDRDPLSPSTTGDDDDDDDPFAGFEDLKDETSAPGPAGSVGTGARHSVGGKSAAASGAAGADEFVGEEFDLGPEFIRRQREEEAVWRRKVEGWVGEQRDMLGDAWRWSIRHMAPLR